MQNMSRQPSPVFRRHSDTPALDRDDPYPDCPSGRPQSIFHLATLPSDPKSLPPVTFSSPFRPAAVCKCNSFHPRSPGRSDSHSAETSVRLRSQLTLVAEAKSGDPSMRPTNAKLPFRPSSQRPPGLRLSSQRSSRGRPEELRLSHTPVQPVRSSRSADQCSTVPLCCSAQSASGKTTSFHPLKTSWKTHRLRTTSGALPFGRESRPFDLVFPPTLEATCLLAPPRFLPPPSARMSPAPALL